MDQPKMVRLMRVMQLLTNPTYYTDAQVAEKLGCSERTVRRYCQSLRESNYLVATLPGGIHRLLAMNENLPNPDELLRFTPEEACVIGRLIGSLCDDNELKHTLMMKLSAIYDVANLKDVFVKKGMEGIVRDLQSAIDQKKQVMLKDYCSAHGKGRRDYLIEPHKMDVNFVSVVAYDVNSRENKFFKLARMGSLEILDTPWEFGKQHLVPALDAFRMSGEPFHVKLELSWRARNLLLEEYPLGEKNVYEEDGRWYFDGEVRDIKGIGRFVMGLAAEVEILEGEDLRSYVSEACADAAVKFRPTAVPGSRG